MLRTGWTIRVFFYCYQYLWHDRPLGLALDPTLPLSLPCRLLYPFALHRLFFSFGILRTLPPMDVNVIPRKPKCKRGGRKHVAGVFCLKCAAASPPVTAIQYSTIYYFRAVPIYDFFK